MALHADRKSKKEKEVLLEFEGQVRGKFLKFLILIFYHFKNNLNRETSGGGGVRIIK